MIKILVVDDEPDVSLLMKQRFRKELKDKTYEMIFAIDGVQALDILENEFSLESLSNSRVKKFKSEEKISIVLTDINMPRMDGLQLCEKIAQLYPHLFTVIISAYGDMDNIRTAMNLGAFDFITKPIDFEDLKKTLIKTILKSKELSSLKRQKSNLNHLVRELHLARDIQEAVMPDSYLNEERVQIYSYFQPANALGGDFYDYFWLDEARVAFLVGDVSGKGVPSAMFMSSCSTLIRAFSHHYSKMTQCLNHVNNYLCTHNPKMMFVTLLVGVLDTKTGEVEIINAGHNKPFLVTADKQVSILGYEPQLALGISPNIHYKSNHTHLQSNDRLVLYTDGAVDAYNQEGLSFKTTGIEQFLTNNSDKHCTELIQNLAMKLRIHSAGIEQVDDITLMAIENLGKKL